MLMSMSETYLEGVWESMGMVLGQHFQALFSGLHRRHVHSQHHHIREQDNT